MFNTCVKLRNTKVKILIYHSSTKLFDIAIKLDTIYGKQKNNTYIAMKYLIYMSIVRVGHINRL